MSRGSMAMGKSATDRALAKYLQQRKISKDEAFRVRVSLVWGFLRILPHENLLLMEVKLEL